MHTNIGLHVETGAGVYCYHFDDRPPILAILGGAPDGAFYLDVTASPDDPEAQLAFARRLLDAARVFHEGTERYFGRSADTSRAKTAA